MRTLSPNNRAGPRDGQMRCFFMRGGHIVAVELLEAESDEHAVQQGRALFDGRRLDKLDGFEIWDRARVVHRHPPD